MKKVLSQASLVFTVIVVSIGVLAMNPRYIAFDEPTASLSDEESKELFTLIELLRRRDISIIYVSHRLEEIFLSLLQVFVCAGLFQESTAVETPKNNLRAQMVYGNRK